MKHLAIAVTVLLLLGSTAYGGWYVGPRAVYAYPSVEPVYAYPPPVVVAGPRVVYSPVVPAPVLAPAPAWVGSGVVVYPRVFVPGQPVRNVLRAVVP
jgi:hypothetical protein